MNTGNSFEEKFSKRRKFAALAPLAIIAFVFGFSALVMVLWNATLPDAIGAGQITFWQAMGILLLSKILFGLRPGRNPWGGNPWHGNPWKWRLRKRLKNMSPEEKEQFKQEMARRWRHWHGGHPYWQDGCEPGAEGTVNKGNDETDGDPLP